MLRLFIPRGVRLATCRITQQHTQFRRFMNGSGDKSGDGKGLFETGDKQGVATPDVRLSESQSTHIEGTLSDML